MEVRTIKAPKTNISIDHLTIHPFFCVTEVSFVNLLLYKSPDQLTLSSPHLFISVTHRKPTLHIQFRNKLLNQAMNSYFSTLLCVFVTVLLCSSLATITTASLVPALCKDIARSDPHQVNYDFCVSQLKSDPRSSNALAPQVGQISFELSITKAKNMSSLVNKLLNDSSLNQTTANTILSDCSKLYADEVQVDLESGLKALKDGDLKTANAKVTSAMYAAATCEEGFKDFWNAPVSLLRLDDEFYQLAAISLGFTYLLRGVN